MNGVFDLSTVARRFRFVAVAEAISWAALLISMGFKYGPTHNAMGVHIFGMVHGIIFVLFVVLAVLTGRALKWSPLVTALALASSVPPFCTVLFEVLAARAGLLGELSAAGAGARVAGETGEPAAVRS
jgi:integral membrane protein